MSDNQKQLGNENSYTKEFLQSFYTKIGVTNKAVQHMLRQTIILAAQAYMRHYNQSQTQLAPHEIKSELKKTINHIDKAAEALGKVYASGNYGEEITNNLYSVISNRYPTLQGSLPHLKNSQRTSPIQSLDFLAALADGIDSTLKSAEPPETAIKSLALYHWIMILSAQLEPVIGHKLKQSKYNDGQYVHKGDFSDSELLQFIIHPLDPKVTISQLETIIKETRKERYENPWDDYFP